MTDLTPKSNRVHIAAVCAFLVLAVALVFGRTVQYGFVNFDDNKYVYENPRVTQGFSGESVAWAFSSFDACNWHPVTWLSHLLDCQLYGSQCAGGHHLTNVLLHAAVAVLLFLMLLRMTGDLWPSAFAAAAFAVHPLRVESVAWVAERKDLLCGLFFMLTLWAYLAYVRRPFSLARYILVAALFALGLMSKPMLVTLPLVLLLLDHWPLGRQLPWWRLAVEKLPLLALSAASCAVTSLAQHTALADLEVVTPFLRISNALVSYVAYIGQFFYPTGLAVFYPYPYDSYPIWKVAGALLFLAGISVGVLTQWRRRPYLPVGWFWYLGMLVPVIGVVQVGSQSMADRYTYLPQIGLAVAIAWGAAEFTGDRKERRWACTAASVAVVAALMACAWRQTAYWSDNVTLWNRASACTADNLYAHNNIGMVLAKCNRVDDAIDHYRKALEIDPRSAITHDNLGNALARQGKIEDAVAEIRLSLLYQPDNAKAHNNLGNLLAHLGQTAAAIDEYQKALELTPDFFEAHNNLGVALAGQGRIDLAVPHFEKALEINPNYDEAHSNLGMALAQQGKVAEAVTHWREAVRLNSTNMRARNRLAWTLATHPESSIRNGEEAVKLAQWAVKLTRGRDPTLLGTLAAAYAETGQFLEAIEAAEQAVSLADSRGDANLAKALRGQLQFYQAGAPYREKR
jgi:protein O-mannosyl-transferase